MGKKNSPQRRRVRRVKKRNWGNFLEKVPPDPLKNFDVRTGTSFSFVKVF